MANIGVFFQRGVQPSLDQDHRVNASGQFAQLVAITEVLHSTTYDDNLDLAGPARDLAARLLGRPVPFPVTAVHAGSA